MPLREYQCDACGHRFEIIQKMSDPPAEKCPVCGGTVQKLQAAPAFHLKGTGWYVTDYAKKDSSTAKTSDNDAKNAEKPAGGKTETTADTAKTTSSDTASSTTPASTPTTTTPKT